MTKICKTKGCNNEIPDGWNHKYCDACRYRRAKIVKEGIAAAGAVAGAVALFGKEAIIKAAQSVAKRL